VRLNPVGLAGAGLSLAALAGLPFLVLRPSRVLSGTALSAAQAAGWAFPALLAVLAALVLLALWERQATAWAAAAGFLADLALGLLFAAAGWAARRLADPTRPAARVSLGAGLWVCVLGLYLVLFACGRKLQRSPWLKSAVLLAGPLAVLTLLLAGQLGGLSLLKEFANRRDTFAAEFARHLALAFGSVAAGAAVGVPLGLLMHRRSRSEKYVFFVVNLAQTIPTLSLLGLLIVPLALLAQRFPLLGSLGIRGVGWTPAGIVLFLYALLPVAGNTLAGFRTVPPGAVEAARGMGLRPVERLVRVELPLAFPVIVAGVRTALTQNLGNAILAGLIGGGGLGSIIFLGLAQAAPDLILLGALPVAGLALACEVLLDAAVRVLTPRGVGSGA
jgi:osmoprotectant transport system permease protein